MLEQEIVGGLEKYDTTELTNKKIEITYKNINSLLGSNISNKDILNVFRRLGFTYEEKGEAVIVEVPRRKNGYQYKRRPNRRGWSYIWCK